MYKNNALPNGEQKQFTIPSEVAQRWNYRRETVVRMCQRGEIPNAIQTTGYGGRWIIPIESIERIEKEQYKWQGRKEKPIQT